MFKFTTPIRRLLLRLSECPTSQDAARILAKLHVPMIGSGMESYVYSRSSWDFVIKIRFYNHCDTDANTICQYGHPKVCAKSMAISTNFGSMIVQEKLDILEPDDFVNEYKLRKRAARYCPQMSDLQAFNIGTRNGQLVSIDWTFPTALPKLFG